MDATAATAAEDRRALGVEIRKIASERAKLDRKSPEYEVLARKHQELMAKFKQGAPKK